MVSFFTVLITSNAEGTAHSFMCFRRESKDFCKNSALYTIYFQIVIETPIEQYLRGCGLLFRVGEVRKGYRS